MIGAMAEGFRVLDERRYLVAAERAAEFVLGTLRGAGGRLLRTYRAGKAHLDAYLEDYAHLSGALIDLYEAGGDVRFLHEAVGLAEILRSDFAAPEGGFYSTAERHETLIVRPREGHDGATPSANAAAAEVLARLSFHLDREPLREEARRAIRAYGQVTDRQPSAFAKALNVTDFLLAGPVELALVGTPGAEDFEGLRREIGRHWIPNRIVALHDPGSGDSSLPLPRGKDLVAGKAALYVCRDFACQAPITDPAAVAEALGLDGSEAQNDRRS